MGKKQMIRFNKDWENVNSASWNSSVAGQRYDVAPIDSFNLPA
jgi:hypothetical protein